MQPTPDQRLLSEAIARQGYNDWYAALLHSALEETQDAALAVKLADEAFAKHPVDTSKPADDDADAVFGGKEEAPPS